MLQLARSLHMRGRMFPKHPRVAYAALPLLLASGAAGVSAQYAPIAGTGGTVTGGGIIVNPISVGDTAVNTMLGVYVGVDACNSMADVVFDLDSVPIDRTTMDVYTGSDCTSQDRDKPDLSNCRYIDTQEIEMRPQDLEVRIPADKLFNGGCDNGQLSMTTLWFLPVDAPMVGEAVSKFGTIPINIDGDPPEAPTSLTGGSGESLIRVTWKTGERDLQEFIVYIDNAPTTGGGGSAGASATDGGSPDGGGSNTSADGACGSNALTSGGSPGELPASIRTRSIKEATATGIDLTPDDIAGDRAAIAVATVDKAGNVSSLSNIACVSVVPTESFWDRYKANGGAAEGGCACRTGGETQWLSSSWPIGLAVLALLRRARKRVS